MSQGRPPIDLSVVHDGDAAYFDLAGDIDAISAPQVRAAVQAAFALGRSDITFNCGQVTFLDSNGLNLIAHAARIARERNGSVAIQDPTPTIRKLLQISAIDTIVDLVETDDRPSVA